MKRRTNMRRPLLARGFALVVSIPASGQEAVNETVVAQIKAEASFVYHAAMRDAMLRRKPLPKPHTDAK